MSLYTVVTEYIIDVELIFGLFMVKKGHQIAFMWIQDKKGCAYCRS